MRKIVVCLLGLSLFLAGFLLFDQVSAAMLNNYGRIPNKVATYYGANGGPARNNPHGYLWGK